MNKEHAERWARVKRMQRLEAEMASLRPRVEQDLRDLIDELQSAGISQKRLGQVIGRSKTVIHHISANQRKGLRALTTWAAKLLSFAETDPKKSKGKPRGNVSKLLRQADSMRGDK